MTFLEYVTNELIEQSNIDYELYYDDSSVEMSTELDYTTQD